MSEWDLFKDLPYEKGITGETVEGVREVQKQVYSGVSNSINFLR